MSMMTTRRMKTLTTAFHGEQTNPRVAGRLSTAARVSQGFLPDSAMIGPRAPSTTNTFVISIVNVCKVVSVLVLVQGDDVNSGLYRSCTIQGDEFSN